MSAMPMQKPGKSKQDYGTPWELIRAVEARWGKLDLDLAAHDNGSNAKAPYWFGPSDDYLSQEWTPGTETDDWLCWCNPPFSDIRPWAKKWREDSDKGARIISLVTAAIGSEWFADEVEGRARVVALRPRITFEGCKDPYPKDCMLLLWGRGLDQDDLGVVPMFRTWRWKP